VPPTTETVAFIAAAGTAVGALIGATSGGFVNFALERARERRRALAGARLVRLDLSLTASFIRDAEHDHCWWVFNDAAVLASWDQYAEAIAPRLSPEQFEDVTQSVGELTRFAREIRLSPRSEGVPFWSLSTQAVAAMKVFRTNATKAHDALASLAKEKRLAEGKLLHDDQPQSPELAAPMPSAG
jgi:hypothetical protein